MSGSMPPPTDAILDMAQARLAGFGLRLPIYLCLAGLAFALDGAVCVVSALGLALLIEAGELRIARHILALPTAARAMALWPGLRRANLAAAIAAAATFATCWYFAAPEHHVYFYGLLCAAAMCTLLFNHQVLTLLLTRQAIYSGTACAMALSDIATKPHVTPSQTALELAPVAIFTFLMVTLSIMTARRYAERQRTLEALKTARDSAERADRLKAHFIATVSHELRTPLCAVLGMAESLLKQPQSPENRRQIGHIVEGGRIMKTLLDDLLDLTQLESGRLALHRRPTDPVAMLDAAVDLQIPAATRKGLALRTEVAPDRPPRLMLDPDRLGQCLGNLLANAIKFTEAGEVSVRLACCEGRVCGEDERHRLSISVCDTGIGIPKNRIEQLFEPFSQADAAVRTRFGGSGLGLSITRSLVERMGGTIAVDSAVGRGSTFQLVIPAVAALGKPVTKAPAAPMAGKRVLIVDDIETNRLVLRLFLEPLGFTIDEVASGEEALAHLAERPTDIVLLDLNMPGLSGQEVALAVRAGRAGPRDVPILALTAVPGTGPCPDAFDGIVGKPVDPARLAKAIHGLIGLRDPAPARSA